jgi:hypothetical protein
MRYLPTLLACLVALAAPSIHAHGGGLNAEGCHNNRKTGDYHCHRGGNASRPIPRQQLAPVEQYRAPASNGAPALDIPPRNGFRPTGAFRNCDAARAAGAAPVHRGEPGYGSHLDRDNDGVGCEPYRGR